MGRAQIYRDFDHGFSYPTWQDTPAYQAHANARTNHYSMKILPQRLLDPTDTINARLRAFIATTPKNIILTNYHEPDDTSPRSASTTGTSPKGWLLGWSTSVPARAERREHHRADVDDVHPSGPSSEGAQEGRRVQSLIERTVGFAGVY